MKEIKKDVPKTAELTKEQINALRSFGKIKLTDLSNLRKYIPEDPNESKFGWIVNNSGSIVIVGDLDLTLEPMEAIYLPEQYTPQKINSSVALRKLLETGVLLAVEDPSSVTIQVSKPIIEQLSKGGRYNAKDLLGPNPYIRQYRDELKKEEQENEQLLKKTRIPEED